ncbi:class I SAM-dependent methyltransferase [Siccirubricoccus sp. KC 17139]|uniref:Class I SAM-dependent methyltransferase n=1 Tax=Siccirubricoccus soli TaxID=2899147 RepID=A0ABT1D5Y9_9PROT|nr:class I SAM-dependent methyltransferase [Siccirubricoccus soli]MCO6416624.1 class I SAM-dependent methyltransferase [Siccirubricoccus soli]MCP2682759.1 class I SAM-dependent methyltransferase [Siccirubricoccus soli]
MIARLLRHLSRWRQRHRRLPLLGDTRLLWEREAELTRWSVKVLGAELAQRHYAAGLAGPAAPVPDGPSPAGLTSRTCRQADIEAPWFRHWCRVLGTAPVYHRKLWEDGFVLQALWEAGMLEPGRRALGFAVGREALPAVLAAQGVEVVATDLAGEDARARDWIETGQHGAAAAALYRPELLAREAFEARVSFRPVDMVAIPAELRQGGFDCLWSVCALEHLGSLEAGWRFVEQAMECLKPGGIAVHTTEFNLDGLGGTIGRGSTVLFQRRHVEALAARVAARGHALLPLDEGHGNGMLDRFVDLAPFGESSSPLGVVFPPHLRLSVRGFPVTSAGLILRAGG